MYAPCKDCENRQIGCHQFCDYYKTWKIAVRKDQEKKREERDIDQTLLRLRNKRKHTVRR